MVQRLSVCLVEYWKNSHTDFTNFDGEGKNFAGIGKNLEE